MNYQLCTITNIQCLKCGQSFEPRAPNQKHCSKSCSRNAKRTHTRATNELDFIGVDGEGVNIVYPDGTKEHRYVMLSVGDQTLWKNGEELTHEDIFPFLYDAFLANPRAVYVGFFLGYDFTNWLKSLPENRARMLFQGSALRQRKGPNPVPFPVYVEDWEIDILGLRRFKIRPHSKLKDNPNPWMFICDTGAYFQTSFLKVIDPESWPTDAPCSPDEFATIQEGKANRSNEVTPGDTDYYADMVRYNILENRVLSRVMRILNTGFVASGVKLQRDSFYGPGQAIQKWLDKLSDSGAYLPHKTLESDIPDWVLEAFQASYYGGRFEITHHGLIPGKTYEYDITSAYPHAMRLLPCLCSNNWTTSRGSDVPASFDILLVYGEFRTRNSVLGSLPYRNSKGNILFPRNTIGWYLWSEVEAGIQAGLIDSYTIHEWIAFTKTCNHAPPLAPIGDLFYTRLKIGKTTPQGKAIKLMINSAYGKFAQSIGSPKYGNPVYASMITSECRRMILSAIATHPNGADDVVMIATDGIYFKSPHPILDALPDREQLGGWEPAVKHNITLMKPGVYWDDKARYAVKNGLAPQIKSRGISAASLSDNIERLDHEFKLWRDSSCGNDAPSLNVTINFAITSPSLALARGKWGSCGHIEWDGTRTESASIAPKRCDPYIEGDFIRSKAIQLPDGSVTLPYQKTFGFERDSWGIDQEGELSDAIQALTSI